MIPCRLLTPFCAALVLAAAPLLPAMAHAEENNRRDPVPKLTVRGEAQLQKPADELQVSIGVVTEHEEVARAMEQNTRRMRDVVTALERAGLEEQDYQTGRFQVQPIYQRRPPRGADPDWEPGITGYRVTNIIQVKTTKIDLAGKVIEAANKAGANTISNVRFGLASPRTHRAEAIAEATAHARSDAQALARAADLRLVRVLSIELDDARPIIPRLQYERGIMAAQAPTEDEPPLRPGDVTIRATVNIVYEIAPRE